jgi:hypothetical protein
MEYQIKIYDIQIDQNYELGVDAVALVNRPAIEELFVALNEKLQLSIDNDKQILIGAALVPDKLIYRVNEKTKEEFYIKFSAETIEKIAQRFFKKGNQLNFNVEHTKNNVDAYVFESWIVEDEETDKSKRYGLSYPKGTWVISAKVEDKEFWDAYVKTGQVRGFSIEGEFAQKLMMKEELAIEPNAGESKDEFISRCIGIEIENGYDQDQAAAICYTKWDNTKLTSASNVVIIAEYDDLANDKLRSYLSVRELMNRIIILSDNPGVSKLQIRNQFGLFVDQVINNDYGRDLRSKLAWRAVKIAEIDNKYKIFEGITSDFRVADLYRKLGVRTVQPTRLSIKPEEAKELMKDIIKQYEKLNKVDLAEGLPHYTADGKLWTGETHKDANGRLMTGAVHTDESEYLYHKHELAESYTDYPKQAQENAKTALRWVEENGWGSCGEATGKARANQLAKGEPISRDTIARMAAFERHRQNSDKELGDGCGRLMWLAWGGDAGVEWAQRKLKQIDNEKN